MNGDLTISDSKITLGDLMIFKALASGPLANAGEVH